MKYVEFVKIGNTYKIWNKVYKIYVGEIRRERFGTWMHYQLFGYKDIGFTNGCLREITTFITSLYNKK